jgi:spore germination protein YaaH
VTISRLRLALIAAVVVLSGLGGALTAAMTRSDPGGPPPRVFAFLSHAGGREAADLARVGHKISVLAPNWYALDLRTAAVRGPTGTSAVMHAARRSGVAVWPVVNARARGAPLLGDRAIRRRLTAAIARIGIARGYAGVTIDIEDLAASDRAAFSALVARVAAALHRHGRKLAVYAPGSDGVGSGAAYDWSSLARSANLLLVSTYARGVTSPTPGPASSGTSFVAAAGRAAAVSRRRVAPTLEAVGYSWPVAGGPATILPATGAARRRARCHARVTTRDDAASFTCRGARVYYPTARELRAQAHEARKRGIRWLALFSLGREPARFWKGFATSR